MKKKLSFELKAKREIKVVDFRDNIVAYRDSTTIEGKTTHFASGFCYKDELEVLNDNPTASINSSLDGFTLMHKDVEELHLTHQINTKYFNKLKSYTIEQSFEFILRNSDRLYDYDLYSFSNSDHHLRDKNGNTLPRAVFFGYMSSNGTITDKYYNLSELRDFLSNNNRIKFLHEGISDIDWFNAKPNETKCLYFIYSPTQEIHDEISNTHTYVVHEKLKKILGFEKYVK